jgi:hypothetical protein
VLLIEVTNARQVVQQRIGKLGARLIGKVVDPEKQVEEALMQEMETAFKSSESKPKSLQWPMPKPSALVCWNFRFK